MQKPWGCIPLVKNNTAESRTGLLEVIGDGILVGQICGVGVKEYSLQTSELQTSELQTSELQTSELQTSELQTSESEPLTNS
jgi:hypothetical protein